MITSNEEMTAKATQAIKDLADCHAYMYLPEHRLELTLDGRVTLKHLKAIVWLWENGYSYD
jgi:hypothetical protein